MKLLIILILSLPLQVQAAAKSKEITAEQAKLVLMQSGEEMYKKLISSDCGAGKPTSKCVKDAYESLESLEKIPNYETVAKYVAIEESLKSRREITLSEDESGQNVNAADYSKYAFGYLQIAIGAPEKFKGKANWVIANTILNELTSIDKKFEQRGRGGRITLPINFYRAVVAINALNDFAKAKSYFEKVYAEKGHLEKKANDGKDLYWGTTGNEIYVRMSGLALALMNQYGIAMEANLPKAKELALEAGKIGYGNEGALEILAQKLTK